MLRSEDPVTQVKGVGEKTAGTLRKLNILTVGDLLNYYPRDYECFEEPVEDLTEGVICAVRLQITGRVNVVSAGKLQIVTTSAVTAAGVPVTLKWFNMAFLRYTLKPGFAAIFRGTFRRTKKDSWLTEQPQFYAEDQYAELVKVLQPVYSLTKGITSKTIGKLVGRALDNIGQLPGTLPEAVVAAYHLQNRKDALRGIHLPESKEALMESRKTIVFEEFYRFFVSMREMKKEISRERNHFALRSMPEVTDLIRSLPYELTGSQKAVWDEIRSDMEGEGIMNRLVQGDVGSGKTILAFLAMYEAALCHYQSVLMAPTEVLAEQHFQKFTQMSEIYRLNLRIALLTGSMTAKDKRIVREGIAAHEYDMVIGTHALIQEKVQYDDLALVITDEQHRFGVDQRQMLRDKGWMPHTLVMSATPIPRTLAMILYGDFSISVMKDLPGGRKPIKNCVVGRDYRPSAYRFIEGQIRAGHQAYVVCPMVEQSEVSDAENVIDYADKLSSVFPTEVKIGILHGKMKPAAKNEIMRAFGAGEIQILVSTTVIEVGIDVPNATVMMIEDAQRFGLAQLHQLRGRVGRGQDQSYCILVNGNPNDRESRRLEIMNQSNDGFFIASEDLKLRGPGDFFGIRQSGLLEFRLGDIYTDAEVLKQASEAAARYAEEGDAPGIRSTL